MNEKIIDIENNLSLQVRFLGEGEQELIILHGWTGSSQDWRPIMDRLSDTCTCISWDQRPYFTQDAAIGKMAQDVNSVIEKICTGKPIILGHSMGAVVVWEYIRQFGCDAIEKLIIVDMTPKMLVDENWELGIYGTYSEDDDKCFIQECEKDFIERVGELIINGKKLTEPQKEAMRNGELMTIRNQRLSRLDQKAWLDCWSSFVDKDYRDVLPTIKVPTLLCYGTDSNFYGTKVANYVHENIPDSTLVMFEGAGHSPHGEQPDTFCQHLLEFVK